MERYCHAHNFILSGSERLGGRSNPDDDVLLGLLLSAALILNLAGWAATILG